MVGNYWHLILYDGETVPVKPENVAYVQKCISKKEHINTPTRTVMIGNIKDFVPTDIPVVDKKQLTSGIEEDAARAFDEYLENPDGSVICKAVKKVVPHRKWDTFYSHNPAYRLLQQAEGGVWVGFMLPVHAMTDELSECTPAEIEYIRSKR
jgi:hypothetical protein